MKRTIYLLLILITLTSIAVAQDKKDKIEIGFQSTALTLFNPEFSGDETFAGAGTRVTYNFNRSFAAEAEVNFFAQKMFMLGADGRAVQVQVGAKAGKRFDKFGLFAKLRPGFLSVNRVFTLKPGPFFDFAFERKNFLTIDAGGVLELYPSRRTVVRFEAGDTIVRHPPRFDFAFGIPLTLQLVRSGKFNHNFQFSAGIGFRLGDFPADNNATTSQGGKNESRRFEVGVQATTLSVDPPSTVCRFCATVTDDTIHTEPGFGGRFTVNLTDAIAVEAEGNYFTRERRFLPDPSGYMFQGQFGAKIGKRFDNWGLFAKARPGFVGFTRVSELVSTRIQLIGTFPVVVGESRTVKQFYPSFDLGGVVEFYVSPRWMARFDVGDTIIRYGELRAANFLVSMPVFTRPAETHHNFQFTSGIGFRF